MTLSKSAIEWYKKEKRLGAKSLDIIRRDTDKLLITILIGNNMVNTWAAALATASTLAIAEKMNIPGDTGLAIVTGAVTLILLMFGEITPKTICTRYAGNVALFVAPIYRVLITLLTPLSFLLNLFVKGVARIFGAHTKASQMSSKELEAFIDISHEEWAVDTDERRQIKNLLSLSDTTADSVMTPRVNVEFVSLHDTIDEVCDTLMNSSHTRIPVCGETTDDVDFVITFREAFKLQKEGHGKAKLKSLDLEKIMKVPLTQPLDDLFEKFQKSRRHIALVLDEHGGTAWVVTMEDVLEEVFGDIKDEKDKEEIYMRKHKGGKIEAVGTVLIDDILEEYDIHAEDYGVPEGYIGEPLSYVVMAEEEEFPSTGTEVIFEWSTGRLILRVTDVHDNVIEKLECEKHQIHHHSKH